MLAQLLFLPAVAAVPTVPLANGIEMPALVFGTASCGGNAACQANAVSLTKPTPHTTIV